MLPLNYAIRNLLRSPSRTLQMIAGSFLVVLLIMSAKAFNKGMDEGFSANADSNNILLIAAGSEESLERSQISASTPGIIAASVKGIKNVMGHPAISPEIHIGVWFKIPGNVKEYEAMFRGITINAFIVHPQVEIIEGTFPKQGEVMIGKMAYKFLGIDKEELSVGDIINYGKTPLKVSGIFQAPGTMMESEIWIDANELMQLTRRQTYSTIILSPNSAEFDDIEYFFEQRLDLELSAIPEKQFYKKLSAFFDPIKYMTWITALLITLGAAFGGLNTMYAAYISRRKEMGTLEVLGFHRKSIYLTLLQEAVIANLIGAIIAMIFSMLFLEGFSISFATGVFYLTFDRTIFLIGLICGIGLGVLGTAVPAWNSLRPALISNLRA